MMGSISATSATRMVFEGVNSVKLLLLRFIRNLLNTLFNILYSQYKSEFLTHFFKSYVYWTVHHLDN